MKYNLDTNSAQVNKQIIQKLYGLQKKEKKKEFLIGRYDYFL